MIFFFFKRSIALFSSHLRHSHLYIPFVTELLKLREDHIYEALLWSDPRSIPECLPNKRGAGVYFGASTTEKFLEGNKLKLVIRSHEKAQEGFSIMHDLTLLTVFSASNYCGKNNNYGAVITFQWQLDTNQVETTYVSAYRKRSALIIYHFLIIPSRPLSQFEPCV